MPLDAPVINTVSGALLEPLSAAAGRDERGSEDEAAGDERADEKTVVEGALDKADVVTITKYSVCAWAYVVIESANPDSRLSSSDRPT